MSPASKSKSKDKKASKESQKAGTKPSVPASPSSGVPASAYNPILGTFHTLELSSTPSASSVQTNGRFRTIDESDEHSGSSLPAGAEYDSVSNTGSWSGESEDHKEKLSNLTSRPETIPGADNDKREKIRQKNEKKHQRQKEKRAQELHERCTGYLMSRKLEALAQQLVSMGFPQERATMALIQNEGRVEESVAWLFDGGEETDKFRDQNLGGSNLKIDISEEVARIADLEIRYKCSKQEVERAVVSNEGDLEKAAETLRMSKLDPPSAPPKPDETGDPTSVVNGKLSVSSSQNLRPQPKSNLPPTIQQRKEDRDFNYTKPIVTDFATTKSLQPPKRVQAKMEWAKPPQQAQPADKRWTGAGANSFSLVSPLQVSSLPAKAETRFVSVGNEAKNVQAGAVREPVIMMQRPQSVNTKPQVQASMGSPLTGAAPSWYPTNNIEVMRSTGFMPQIPSSTRSLSPNTNPMYLHQQQHQFHYQPQLPHQPMYVPGASPVDSPGTSRGNGLWSRAGSPGLSAASSLGLFSAGSSGASSPVDWNTGGSMLHLDYTNIDWTLDRGLPPSRPNGLLLGVASYMKSNTSMNMYEAKASGAQPLMRPGSASSNVNAVSIASGASSSDSATAAGFRDWTSPFEGEDLFTVPRQFVSSPSL